jgi:ribose transport system permease protein
MTAFNLPLVSSSNFKWARSTPAYIAVALVVLLVAFAILGPEGRFLSEPNLQAIGRNSAGLVFLAVGLTFVLGAGHIDLSVGATLVLSSVCSGMVAARLGGPIGSTDGGPSWLALLAAAAVAVLVGIMAGLLNGVLVTRLKVNSFVITLGTLGIFTGVAQVLTNGSNVSGIPPQLQTGFGLQTVLSVPLPLVVALVAGVVFAVLLTSTRTGRHTLAVGSAAQGALRAGVKVDRSAVKVFVIAGALAGAAGFLDISRFGTTAISGHETTMLQALSAVIIGGTSLFGGRASVPGSIIATFIPTVLLSGFVMIGVSSFYQKIAIGAVLIIAVWLDQLRNK